MISMQRVWIVLSFAAFVVVGNAQTPVDTLLQGKEYKLSPLDSTYRSKGANYDKAAGSSDALGKDNVVYVLQFDAIADFDAAQSRRADLQRRTGLAIQMVFDSPFYKLRAGGWAKKEDADEQARQLSDNHVQTFVVKIQK